MLSCHILSRLAFYFFLLLLAFSFFSLAFLFWEWNRAYHFPFQYEFTEGTTAYGAYRVSQGEPLYVDFKEPPYVAFGYPPLFYYFLSALTTLFHFPVLAAGRLLSFLGGIGIACLIFLLGQGKGFAFLSAVTFLFNPFVNQELLLCAPNTLALFWGLLALYLALKGKWQLSLFFISLLFLTKPLFLALPATAFYVFYRRHDRSFLKVFFSFFLFQFFFFTLLFFGTRGAILDHLFFAHQQPYEGRQIFLFFFYHLKSFYPLLLVLLSLPSFPPHLLCLLISGFVPVLLSAKLGASPIYFSEVLLAFHLILAQKRDFLFKRAEHKLWSFVEIELAEKNFRVFLALAGFAFFLFLHILRMPAVVYNYTLFLNNLLRTKVPLVTLVRSTKGQVLTEDADLSFLAHVPWLYEAFNARYLFQSSRKDLTLFRRLLKEGKIKIVVAGPRLKQDPFVAPYLKKEYVFVVQVGSFEVFQYARDYYKKK